MLLGELGSLFGEPEFFIFKGLSLLISDAEYPPDIILSLRFIIYHSFSGQ